MLALESLGEVLERESYDRDHILLDFCGKRYEAEESGEV